MRIDVLLNRLCLFKTRSQAGKACDGGRVRLNGQPARSSKDVHPGDRIRYRDPLERFEEEVEVLGLPQGSVSKTAARDLYRVISRHEIEDSWNPSGPEGQ